MGAEMRMEMVTVGGQLGSVVEVLPHSVPTAGLRWGASG